MGVDFVDLFPMHAEFVLDAGLSSTPKPVCFFLRLLCACKRLPAEAFAHVREKSSTAMHMTVVCMDEGHEEWLRSHVQSELVSLFKDGKLKVDGFSRQGASEDEVWNMFHAKFPFDWSMPGARALCPTTRSPCSHSFRHSPDSASRKSVTVISTFHACPRS